MRLRAPVRKYGHPPRARCSGGRIQAYLRIGALRTTGPRPRLQCLLLLLLLPALASGCGDSGEWHEGEGFRWRKLKVRGGDPGFEPMPASRTGVRFVNAYSEEALLQNDILVTNGGGVAIGDVDGDGRPDVFFTSVEGRSSLYRNLGNWRFEEVTEEAGVAIPRGSRGAVLADVNGNGHLDLLVAMHGERNRLFLNDGTGRFRDATGESGFEGEWASHTLTLADVDGNGFLDLYVTNYKRRWARDIYSPRERAFSEVMERRGDGYVVKPKFREHFRVIEERGVWRRWEYAEPDEFYLNDGTGRFERVSLASGRFLDDEGKPLDREPDEWGLTARFHDIDGDGTPDLYVCNDLQSPDFLFLNDGTGVFRAVAPLAVRKTSTACMAVDFSDIDRDGHVDFFAGEMLSRDPARRKRQVPEAVPEPTWPGEIETRPQVRRNTLQWSRGDGTFAEVAWYAGVAASEWTWGTLFLDVDLDGYEDLLVTTGTVVDWMDADAEREAREFTGPDWREARFLFPRLEVPNLAFRNLGDLRFEETGEGWGFSAGPDISHGIAAGDLDGDGDLDVVVNRLGAPPLLLRNVGRAPRVAVRLVGEAPNTRGIGARVKLLGGPVPEQSKEVSAGGLYLSSSEPVVVFAAPGGGPLTLVVEWRSGRRSVVRGVRPNREYEVHESGAEAGGTSPEAGSPGARRASPEAGLPGATSPEPGAAVRPYFHKVELGHRHAERPFLGEFVRQPLVPMRLAQLGPGVSWEDVDGDGYPDLLIASGGGGRLALHRNDGGELVRAPLGVEEARYDQTTVLGLPLPEGGKALLVGQMNYEARSPSEADGVPSVLRLEAAGGRSLVRGGPVRTEAAVPGDRSSTGPLALADIDLDGSLDLFVGGRVLPGSYPVPATSRMFRNEGGRFRLDEANTRVLASAGLVSGAVFSDVDGDGYPDLVLALEWGPVRLYLNEGGRFREATREWGLAAYEGRWNGVATGDFTGNGLPDIVATSWGENTGYRVDPERPLYLYFADFDGNGTLDVVQAQWEPGLGGLSPLHTLQELTSAMAHVRRYVPTHAAFAAARLEDVLGPAAGEAQVVRATTLSHMLFLNRGDRFEAVPLPREAQLAPAFYAGVADFDGDGNEDLFLTQNFFATDLERSRYDAGRSLWLRGDGRGGLEPVPGEVSGVKVYGDPRGAALADYDGDGRVDLAVSQNGAETLLYRNVGAMPGLRVRLAGPPGNPEAVGSAVRLLYADGSRGPAREVQAGSGYWSRDGAVQVLGLGGEPAAVWVRWPGGEETTTPVEAGARELTVRWP